MSERAPYQPAGRRFLDRAPPKPRPATTPPTPANHVVFLSGINFHSDGSVIREKCETYGALKHFAENIADRGRAYATFFDIRDAQRCVDAMHRSTIEGRIISVQFARPRTPDGHGCTTSLYVRIVDREGKPLVIDTETAIDPTGVFCKDEISALFSRAGELREIRETAYSDEYFVQYYNIQDAKNAFTFYDNIPYGPWRLCLTWMRMPRKEI